MRSAYQPRTRTLRPPLLRGLLGWFTHRHAYGAGEPVIATAHGEHYRIAVSRCACGQERPGAECTRIAAEGV